MKKKLFTGFSLMAVAGMAFWACGDGNINKIDENDNLNAMMYPDSAGWDKFKVEQKQACKSNPSCMEMFGAYVQGNELPVSSAEEVVSSSSEAKDPNAGKFLSSSQAELDIDGGDIPSSSSMNIIDDGPATSSSEAATVVTGLGSCKPTKNPIDKGTSTTWTFVPNPTKAVSYGATAFTQAQYQWNYGQGLSDDGKGIGTASGAVTYANSGPYGASVVVSIYNKETKLTDSETIECASLQVNGDPITGCTCTTEATSVDYTTTPGVDWTVKGCTTASMPLTYEWDGTEGAETYTKTFDAAQMGYAPTLKVGNSDNTVISVTCPAVKTTKGAEYTIEKPDTKIALPAGESNVVLDLPENWHNGTQGTCTLRCNGNNQAVTITVGDDSATDNSATLSIPIAKTINKSSLVIGLSVDAECMIGW